MPLNLKDLFSGGLKGIGDTAKDIIKQVADNKVTRAEADILLDKEINRHEEMMADKAYQTEKMLLEDVANARDANVKIQESEKASWLSKNIAYMIDIWLALVWGVFTFYVLALWARVISAKDVDFTGVLSLYTTVTTVFMIVVSFHRGTSQGSHDKQKLLDRLQRK